MQNQYKKAGFYYLIGTIFQQGISFLTIPVFTRILDTSEYGIVNTYNSWVGILSIIIGLALHMAVRASFLDFKEKTEEFLSSILFFTLLFGGVILLFTGVAGVFLWNRVSVPLILICIFHSLSVALINDVSMYLMMKVKYKSRCLLLILPNLLAVAISIPLILFVLNQNKYYGRIGSNCAIHVIAAIIVLGVAFARSKPKFNIEYIKYGLRICGPIIFHGIALNLLSQSDRTMITLLADSTQTGIYSLIYNYSTLAVVFTSAIEAIWVPWFNSCLQKGEREIINKRAKDYLLLITIIMIGIILLGPEIVKLLAKQEYWEGFSIIPPLVLSNYFILMYTFYVDVEHYYKKTIIISINTMIAAGVNIGLNFAFIPKFGYVAAAYTTLASYFFTFLLHIIFAKRLDKSLYPIKMFLVPLIYISTAVVIFYCLLDWWYYRWAIGFVFLCIMILINFKKIKLYLFKGEKDE